MKNKNKNNSYTGHRFMDSHTPKRKSSVSSNNLDIQNSIEYLLFSPFLLISNCLVFVRIHPFLIVSFIFVSFLFGSFLFFIFSFSFSSFCTSSGSSSDAT